MDLTRFPRETLAQEAARMIWQDWQDKKAYESQGAVEYVTQALARFGDFLPGYDPAIRISSFRDITERDVDAFDLWLHEVAFSEGSVSPYGRISGFVLFLSRALDAGMASADLAERLRYASKYHDFVATQPRDAYDELTMANLRAAARKDVTKILARFRKGRKLLLRGEDPFFFGSRNRPEDVLWSLEVHGMPTQAEFKELQRIYARRQFTAPQLLDLRYLSIENCVPFLVLLADATGLPIECIHELKADCLEEPYARFSGLRYIKRRQTLSDEEQVIPFPAWEPYSPGWLVRRLLFVTAPARRDLGFEEHEGSLFIGRVGLRIQEFEINAKAIAAWLRHNPVVCDAAGDTLPDLQLSRIRKSYKAQKEYIGGGGSLAGIRRDHSLQVFSDHYARIPFLSRRHDDAIAAGLTEAHDAAMKPHVFGGESAEQLSQDPASMAAALKISEESAREVLSGFNDSWTAGCLSFLDSPFSEKGQPCGAPVFGCLDCGNAVITSSKLPALVRLSEHVERKRQQMRLDDWKRNYGFLFIRLRQILDMFPEALLDAARNEAAIERGRDWTFAQLAYRMGEP